MHINANHQPGLADMRLMQLVSPTLPIGAFTYSQGLEWAVDSNTVNNSADVFLWLEGLIKDNLTYLDLPILKRLYQAVVHSDEEQVMYWSRYLLASRETKELRQEEINRGRALCRLILDLDIQQASRYEKAMSICQTTGFAVASYSWEINLQQAATGFAWSWIENQVAAAVKLVPLGQTDGQKLQMQLSELIPEAIHEAMQVGDDMIGASSPAMAIASSFHETQYTRLFRS